MVLESTSLVSPIVLLKARRNNKDSSSLGCILGSPCSWKVPNISIVVYYIIRREYLTWRGCIDQRGGCESFLTLENTRMWSLISAPSRGRGTKSYVVGLGCQA